MFTDFIHFTCITTEIRPRVVHNISAYILPEEKEGRSAIHCGLLFSHSRIWNRVCVAGLLGKF